MADTKVVLSLYLGFLTTLLCCVGLGYAQVETEPRVPVVRLGEKIDLLCKAPMEGGARAPLLYCRFEIPGEQAFRVSPEMNVPGISWFGERTLEEGECGITIQRVQDHNNGPVKCSLGLKNSDREFNGVLDLTVGVAPREPQWIDDRQDSNRDRLVKDDEFNKVCGVDGGRPTANITFFLDDQEILDPNVAHQLEFYDNNYDNNTSAIRRISYRLRAEDDGKTLVCRAIHFAYPDGHADTPYRLRVYYPPQPRPEQTVYGIQVEKTAFVTISIQANPRPKVSWLVDNSEIQEGSYQDRYEARTAVDASNGERAGFYNVTLVIDKVTPEDFAKVYRLKAFNEYGQQEYTARISSTGAPLDSSPLDVGTIVGIVVAGVLVLALVGLLIVARATGRWCFAAKPDNSRNKNESGVPVVDEEAGQLKATAGQQLLTFKQRLLSMVAAARNAGKHEDEKGIDNDEENEKISTETAIIEDVPVKQQAQEGKKDPNQLIYAELDIKNTSDSAKSTVKKPTPDKPADTTEYAEILYVSSPGAGDAKETDSSKPREKEIK